MPLTLEPSVINVCAIARTPSSVGASRRASTGSAMKPASAGITCVGR